VRRRCERVFALLAEGEGLEPSKCRKAIAIARLLKKINTPPT
jgi:hypothetical protein